MRLLGCTTRSIGGKAGSKQAPRIPAPYSITAANPRPSQDGSTKESPTGSAVKISLQIVMSCEIIM